MVGGGWVGGEGVGAISLADLFSLSVRGTPLSFKQVHSTSLFCNPRIIRDFCFVLISITRFIVYRPL